MKTYIVTAVTTRQAYYEIEANSSEEAIDIYYDTEDEDLTIHRQILPTLRKEVDAYVFLKEK